MHPTMILVIASLPFTIFGASLVTLFVVASRYGRVPSTYATFGLGVLLGVALALCGVGVHLMVTEG